GISDGARGVADDLSEVEATGIAEVTCPAKDIADPLIGNKISAPYRDSLPRIVTGRCATKISRGIVYVPRVRPICAAECGKSINRSQIIKRKFRRSPVVDDCVVIDLHCAGSRVAHELVQSVSVHLVGVTFVGSAPATSAGAFSAVIGYINAQRCVVPEYESRPFVCVSGGRKSTAGFCKRFV